MSEVPPTIEELIEIVQERRKQLASCCGRCHHCRASVKIIRAFERYDEARLSEWPEEVAVCDKCGSMSDVGGWGPDGGLFDLCRACWKDTDGLHEWLEKEIRQTLDNDPDYELQADGETYKFIGEVQGK